MILTSIRYPFESIAFTRLLDPARTTTLSHGRHFGGAVPFSINCSALDDSADAKIQVVLSHCGGSRSLHGDTFLLRTSLPCVWEQFLFRPLQHPDDSDRWLAETTAVGASAK